MDELWNPVPGCGGYYEASSKGRIRVKPRVIVKPHSTTGELLEYSYPGRLLSIYADTGGYLFVTLGVGGKTMKRPVHTLVAEAFHGTRPQGSVVCHNNGLKTDNRPENLRWDTQLENNRDRRRHGTLPIGEKHPNARLKQADIDSIRANRLTYQQVMATYGISQSQAWRITSGKAWI